MLRLWNHPGPTPLPSSLCPSFPFHSLTSSSPSSDLILHLNTYTQSLIFMALKLEKWVEARGFISPIITCVVSGTKSGFTTRLRMWSCSLAEQNRGYPMLSKPHTEVIRPQEAEPDIADTRPPYHILPQHPPTPHNTTSLHWSPTHCGNRKVDLHLLIWSQRMEESKKKPRNLRSVKKKDTRRNFPVVTSSSDFPLSKGLAADVNKRKQFSLSVSDLLTARGVTTVAAGFLSK